MYHIDRSIFNEIHNCTPRLDPKGVRYLVFDNFSENRPAYQNSNDPKECNLAIDFLSRDSFLYGALQSYFGYPKMLYIPFYTYQNVNYLYVLFPKVKSFSRNKILNYSWFYYDDHGDPARHFIRWCNKPKSSKRI